MTAAAVALSYVMHFFVFVRQRMQLVPGTSRIVYILGFLIFRGFARGAPHKVLRSPESMCTRSAKCSTLMFMHSGRFSDMPVCDVQV